MYTAAYIGSLINAQRLAYLLQPAGYDLVVFDPDATDVVSGTEGQLTRVATLQELTEKVASKRIICLDITPPETVDAVLEDIKFSLAVSDVIIHIAQAPAADTVRRARDLEALQLHLLDCSLTTPPAATLAVGGNRFAFNDSLPLLQAIAPHTTIQYAGRPGAGHAATQPLHNTPAG